MAKSDKKMMDKIKAWAQGDEMYEEYDDMPDDMKDYSGKSAKSFNVFYMKNVDEYKGITECLKRGSACAVNLEGLSEEEVRATVYRIEGIIDAVKGDSIYLSKGVLQLLPEGFVVRTLNELE